MTMGAILADIGMVVTNAMTWAGNVVTFITDNPLVELGVVVTFVGLGIGILSRVFGLRA